MLYQMRCEIKTEYNLPMCIDGELCLPMEIPIPPQFMLKGIEVNGTYYIGLLVLNANTMEIHEDGIQKGQKVLILDDLLATGGTLGASAKLVEMTGGTVAEIGVIIELSFLEGRNNLSNYNVFSMIQY